MIYLIKSHVNGNLGVSDHIVEEANPVIGTYDTVDDAIRFLRILKKSPNGETAPKEPMREYEKW